MPTVIFTLKQYLSEQSALRQRSKDDRPVPSQIELSRAVGRHEVTFSRLLNNRSDTINMTTLAAIMSELRKHGLNPTFDDLFLYKEQE